MCPRIIVAGLALGVALVTACGSGEDELGSDDALTGHGRLSEAVAGRPGGGGTWLGNGLEDPDVSGVDPRYGLSTEQGLDNGLLADEVRRNVAEYLVECALPEGEAILKIVDGRPLFFEGALGLAPEWKDGECDEECQEWVTACLLARTNVTGQTVGIWLTGEHPSLGIGRSGEHPQYEATFYGNLFRDPTAQYFCRGTVAGVQMAYVDGRTCSDGDVNACGFTTFGACLHDQRCATENGIPTACVAGDPETGVRYHALTTFVDIPEEWPEG